jgi:ligand-binding sensor domain-containing protein
MRYFKPNKEKKNYLTSFAFGFLFLLGHSTLSQQLTFNPVVPPSGNFNGGVNGISQDNNGYMWFATVRGLYRYDGYKFKIYLNDLSNSNSLSSNHLATVYADHNGIIWIATSSNGVDRLNPQTGIFTHFGRASDNPSRRLVNDTVRAILEDREGILWIGTHGGLDRLDPETGKVFLYQNIPNDSSSLSSNIVRALYEDRDGTLWVGTGSTFPNEGGAEEGGLNRFDRKTGRFTRYKHDLKNLNSLINNKVRAIFEDSKGVFWVGTAGDGLHTMDRINGTFIRHKYDPSNPEKLSRPSIAPRQRVSNILVLLRKMLQEVYG